MSTSADRKNVLKQMKVRTTYRKDKSWIHQSSEDERDETPEPMSPQLKSLEGKKFHWSPTPDSKTERDSGTFTAKEVYASSLSPPVHARNKQNSYSSIETNKSTSTTSQPSPPPSTTGGTKTPSYIIRGQPLNSVSQVKNQYSFNGYQKSYSTAQPRTSSSLPRVPTATGYKMSTEEYKKLAPYNVRSGSVDLSDDELQERPVWTEDNSKVLKATPQRDSSYVTSAANRSSRASHNVRSGSADLSDDEGLFTQEQSTRSDQSSKVLKTTTPRESSYVTSAAKRSSGASYNVRNRSADPSDDEGIDAQEQSTRTEPTSKVLKSTPPRDSSFVTSSAKRSSGIGTEETSPFVAKRVQIQEEENSLNKKNQTLPKTLSSYLYEDNKTAQIQEEENSPNKKSQTLPKTLSSYLYEDNKKFENNWKDTQSKQTTSQTIPSALVTNRSSSPQLTSYSTSNVVETKSSTVKPEPAKVTFVREESNSDKSVPKPAAVRELSPVTTRRERVETTKRSDTLPESLASYLYDDVNRYEKGWKSNQSTQSTSKTVTKSGTDRPESPKLTSWSTNTDTKTSIVKPDPGRVTVLRDESGTSHPNIPRLTSSNTETKSSNMQSGPGKVAVLTEGSKDVQDALKLTLSSLPTSAVDSTQPMLQAGPGKVTVIRDKSDVDNGKARSEILTTTTTGRAKITIETITESTPPKPAPRMETKPKEAAAVKTSDKQEDLISWSDLDDNTSTRIAKGRSVSPTPAPIQTYKASEKSTGNPPLSIVTPELKSSRSNQPTKPGSITTVEDTKVNETRYRVPESIDQEPNISNNKINQPSKPGSITTVEDTKVNETRYRVPESLDPESYISNNKSNQPTKPGSITTVEDTKVNETRYRVPESIDQEPNISNNKTNQPTKPGSITTVEDTKVNETRYRVPESIDQEPNISNNKLASGNKRVTVTTPEPQPERPRTPEQRSSSPRPIPRPRESTKTLVPESRYRVSETLEDTMLEASPSRSSSRTTVTTTRSTDPVHTEYTEGADKRSSRTVSSSTEKITTTTTTETQYENSYSAEAGQYDPQSSNNKGVLFVKEYVNSRESLKSPTTSGSFTDFSDDSERVSYSSSSSYLYSSPPDRSDEGPCTYCGRPIKDCPKIILEHLNIYCHEYCFKCGICNKPMGDLVDSLFIHRDVVHCENCYEKLF